MSEYITGFAVYTFAIIGVILLAFVIAKKSMMSYGMSGKRDIFLDVEQSLNIAPRKTVQVVRAGNEKFLIALDPERTTFLTKLSSENSIQIDTELSAEAEVYTEKDEIKQHTSVLRSVLAKLSK